MLGVHEMHQQFLCFAVAGVFYQYTALPMGCSISPLVYTKFMRVVARFLRYSTFTTAELYRTAGVSPQLVRAGLRLLIYLDDLCVLVRPGPLGLR